LRRYWFAGLRQFLHVSRNVLIVGQEMIAMYGNVVREIVAGEVVAATSVAMMLAVMKVSVVVMVASVNFQIPIGHLQWL